MKKIIIIFVLVSFALISSAQDAKSYYFSPNEENLLMIRVNVWGQVNNPNSILVPDGTDLLTAVSAAGGPNDNAQITNILIIGADGSRRVCDIAKFKSENNRNQNPILRPGDTVFVKGSFIYGLTKVLDFVYKTAIIASTALAAYNIYISVTK